MTHEFVEAQVAIDEVNEQEEPSEGMDIRSNSSNTLSQNDEEQPDSMINVPPSNREGEVTLT